MSLSHPTLRQAISRCALAALCALLATAAVGAASASAAGVFGGLGSVAKYKYGPGAGEIVKGQFAFAVDHKTGRYFVADIQAAEVRLQEFNGTHFVGKAVVSAKKRLAEEASFSGLQLAVDEADNAIYLLVDQKRPEHTAAVAKEIKEKEQESNQALIKLQHAENELAKAEEKKESQQTIEELKKEVAEDNKRWLTLLEEESALEEIVIFDEEVPVAGELYAFKTTVSGSELPRLTSFKTLEAEKLGAYASEDASEHAVPILAPSGLAVDPKTHEVLISGEQEEGTGEEASKLGEEQEFEKPLAIVQRVHASGELGARYVDAEDCLDDGELYEDDEGNPCAKYEEEEEFPTGLVVSGEGRAYLLDNGPFEADEPPFEIWEFPVNLEAANSQSYAGAAEAAKAEVRDEAATGPRHVFSLPEAEGAALLTARMPEFEYDSGETAFAMTSAGAHEDAIYSLVDLNEGIGSTALLLLHLDEAGSASSVTEEHGGWTAGVSEENFNPSKCRLPHHSPLALAADGEDALVLAFNSGFEGAQPEVLGYGPEGEACGEPKASEPAVSKGEAQNLSEVRAGELVTVSSKLEDGDALASDWQFKLGSETEEAHTAFQGRTSSVEHAFAHIGEYEIIDTIATDNLAHPQLVKVRKKFEVTASLAVASLKLLTASPLVGEEVKFQANVSDEDEPEPKLEYTWSFGDGAEVKGKQGSSSSHITLSQAHSFASAGTYEVTLTVKDGSNAQAKAVPLKVVVAAPPPPTTSTETTPTTTPATTSTGGGTSSTTGSSSSGHGGVLGFVEAKLLSATKVSAHGVFKLKLSCPGSVATCVGSLIVRSAGAISAGHHKKKAILTLARGTFSVTPGQAKLLTLRLSATALALLKHLHTLRAAVMLTADQGGGPSKTTRSNLALRLAKAPAHHHK